MYILVKNKWPDEIPNTKKLNIFLEWNKILFLKTCKLSYIFSDVWFG